MHKIEFLGSASWFLRGVLIAIFAELVFKPIGRHLARSIRKYMKRHPLHLKVFLHYYSGHKGHFDNCKQCNVLA